MTTALFLLRLKQLNFTLDEIDQLTTGQLYDVLTESVNDGEKYEYVATQADFDRF